MNSQIMRNVEFHETLKETLEQFAEDGCLVDVLLKDVPTLEESQENSLPETQSVRIILVAEDYIVLGPKRPLISCFVPIDSILMVRVSDATGLEDEEEIDREIEENCFGWQREWPTFNKVSIPADGTVHNLDSESFDPSVKEDDLVVVFYADGSKSSSKVADKIERLAREFNGQVIFVRTEDPKLAEDIWLKKAPSVAIVVGDEVFSQIDGVAGIGEYRSEIREVLDEISEEED